MGHTQYTQVYRSGIEPPRRGLGSPPEVNALRIEPNKLSILKHK